MRVNTGNTVALSKVSFYHRNAGEYQAKWKKEYSRRGKSSKKTNKQKTYIQNKNKRVYQISGGILGVLTNTTHMQSLGTVFTTLW